MLNDLREMVSSVICLCAVTHQQKQKRGPLYHCISKINPHPQHLKAGLIHVAEGFEVSHKLTKPWTNKPLGIYPLWKSFPNPRGKGLLKKEKKKSMENNSPDK